MCIVAPGDCLYLRLPGRPEQRTELTLDADAMRLAVSRRPPVRDCMHMLPPIWLVAILTRLTQKLKI